MEQTCVYEDLPHSQWEWKELECILSPPQHQPLEIPWLVKECWVKWTERK